MARNGIGSKDSPISIPPFSGATRTLLVWNIVCFFVLAVLAFAAAPVAAFIVEHLGLIPLRVLHGELWQLATYSFLNYGMVNTLFAMMSLWYAGNMLEDRMGANWLYGAYFSSVVGGALVSIAVAYTGIFGLSPYMGFGGCWAGIFGLLVAIAYFYGDMEMNVMFVLRMKAKVMVALYILIFTAELLTSAQRFAALVQLAGGLCGFLYCRFAPRRGYGSSLSERFYAMRNEYYRRKRRKAAKKFEVYMGKQGRDVHFDSNGRYVEPDDRDPNDKRWMN